MDLERVQSTKDPGPIQLYIVVGGAVSYMVGDDVAITSTQDRSKRPCHSDHDLQLHSTRPCNFVECAHIPACGMLVEILIVQRRLFYDYRFVMLFSDDYLLQLTLLQNVKSFVGCPSSSSASHAVDLHSFYDALVQPPLRQWCTHSIKSIEHLRSDHPITRLFVLHIRLLQNPLSPLLQNLDCVHFRRFEPFLM